MPMARAASTTRRVSEAVRASARAERRVKRLRRQVAVPLLLKGILDPRDARELGRRGDPGDERAGQLLLRHRAERRAALELLGQGRRRRLVQPTHQHPGGDEVLLTEAGNDATEPFEDVGHSEDARSQLDKLFIGTLADPENLPKRAGKASDMASEGSSSALYIALIAGLVAVAGYFLLNKSK